MSYELTDAMGLIALGMLAGVVAGVLLGFLSGYWNGWRAGRLDTAHELTEILRDGDMPAIRGAGL